MNSVFSLRFIFLGGVQSLSSSNAIRTFSSVEFCTEQIARYMRSVVHCTEPRKDFFDCSDEEFDEALKKALDEKNLEILDDIDIITSGIAKIFFDSPIFENDWAEEERKIQQMMKGRLNV